MTKRTAAVSAWMAGLCTFWLDPVADNHWVHVLDRDVLGIGRTSALWFARSFSSISAVNGSPRHSIWLAWSMLSSSLYTSPICWRTLIVSCASCWSILLMAKPTWIRTQSPGPIPSGRTNATLTLRFTPETSTLAMELASSTMSVFTYIFFVEFLVILILEAVMVRWL